MEDQQEFTVRDRRRTDDGAGPEQPSRDRGADRAPYGQEQPPLDQEPSQEIDFPSFIISLAASVQISLGAVPHPGSNEVVPCDLPAAKQIIDILAMLQTKTKGNLTDEEAALLEQVLVNLRIHYVRVAEEQKKSGGS